MTPSRRARDPLNSVAQGPEPCPGGAGRARPGAAGWIAGFLLPVAAVFPGCFDQESKTDPLRIPWSQVHVPDSGSRPATRSSSAAPVGEELQAVVGGAARRRELRELHSPLEIGGSGYRSTTVNDCRSPSCHADLAPGPEIHSRLAAAACTRCHVPQGEPAEHRWCMVDADGGVCRTCHVPHQGAGVSHAPFRESRCLDCHSPHRSVETKLLGEPAGAGLCLQCHEVASEVIAHRPYAEGRCLSCHDAHESRFAGLTRESSAELCLGCHDREIAVPGRERPLPDMAALICTSRFAHGPIRAGDCSPCHDSHGAPNANLLREAFPQDFYQAWDPTLYALCFQCHSSDLATDARTTTRTGFRDGDRNLHYVHVNREKGRSCRACHEVHATNVPFHLRESVSFGSWELPIVYEQRPNGGACGPTCHQAKSYDRTRPPPAEELTKPAER